MAPPLITLDLLRYREALRIRHFGMTREVWDPIRRRYVALTPEEMVRQLLIRYLVQDLNVSRNRLSVEKQIRVHGRNRRYDLVIHDGSGDPLALVECKRPEVALDQAWLDQIGRYNQVLGVSWLLVTNGPQTVCLRLNHDSGQVEAVTKLPDFHSE